MATISRLYKDYDTGARVVSELGRSGIPHTDISIVSNNERGWFDRDRPRRIDRDADGTDDRVEGAATGAGIAATLAGVAGLLAGLGMLVIPGIGPVVAAGWLVSTAAMAANTMLPSLCSCCQGRVTHQPQQLGNRLLSEVPQLGQVFQRKESTPAVSRHRSNRLSCTRL